MTPLSDDDKNRRIAEFLEPNPDMNSKCWVLTPPMIATSGILPKEWRQPRDFANDPAMRWLLLMKCVDLVGDHGWKILDALNTQNPGNSIRDLFMEMIDDSQ